MPITRLDPLLQLQHAFDDEPMQLREWATERVYALPPPSTHEKIIGAGSRAWLRIQDGDGFVSRRHASLRFENDRWTIKDDGSKNGLWIDGQRVTEFSLTPGAEIGLGRVRLLVETLRLVRIRQLLARWIGWDNDRRGQIDRTLRAVRWFIAGRSPLLVVGEGDVVAIAHNLHREALGDEAPFLLSDPRRRSPVATARHVENFASSVTGFRAAEGGTLCIWAPRLPHDFNAMRLQRENAASRTRLMLCARTVDQLGLVSGGVLELPPVSSRAGELARVVHEYADDAIKRFGAATSSFTAQDFRWVMDRRPDSMAEVERATLRRVALREFGGVTAAAEKLGLTHGAFSRWLARRVRSAPMVRT